jgi:hypothetical protein
MHFAQVRHRFRDQCDIPLESARLIEYGSGQFKSVWYQMYAWETGSRLTLGMVSGRVWHHDHVEQHLAYPGVVSVFTSDRLHQRWMQITLRSSVRTLRLSVKMALSQLGTSFTTFLFHRCNQRICPSQNDVCWGFWPPLAPVVKWLIRTSS